MNQYYKYMILSALKSKINSLYASKFRHHNIKTYSIKIYKYLFGKFVG